MLLRIGIVVLVAMEGLIAHAEKPPPIPKLLEQVRASVADYNRWSVAVDRRFWAARPVANPTKLSEHSWEAAGDRAAVETLTVDAPRFRFQQTVPSSQAVTFCFDGRIARGRDVFHAINGPLRSVGEAGFVPLVPATPHGMTAGLHPSPDLSWLFKAPLFQASGFRQSSPESDRPAGLEVLREDLGGQACWKVKWEDDRERRCAVWLARDRDFLPLKVTATGDLGRYASEIRGLQSLRVGGRDLWFPRQIVALMQFGGVVEHAMATVRTKSFPDDPRLFSSAKWQGAKLSPAVAPNDRAGTRYLLQPPAQGLPASTSGSTHWSRKRMAVVASIVILAMVLFGVVALLLHHVPAGRRATERLRDHRLLVAGLGIGVMLATGLAARNVPGWQTHGVPLILCGGVGLVWLMLTVIAMGRRSLSIRWALALAFCFALIFAGYSRGLDRMNRRQQMITQVRLSGGEVEIDAWPPGREPLYLPEAMVRFLGDGFRGRIQKAVVPAAQFLSPAASRWCFDEASTIWVAPTIDRPFRIDGTSLGRLRHRDALREFRVIGGTLDPAAYRQLGRFPNLQRLQFDGAGEAIPHTVFEIESLRDLTVRQVRVDKTLADVVTRLPDLSRVTLDQASFSDSFLDVAASAGKLDQLSVGRTRITGRQLQRLAEMGAKTLILVRCQLIEEDTTPVDLAETDTAHFVDTNLDDSWLTRLRGVSSLKLLSIRGSRITPAGLEAFSARRPDVVVMVRLSSSPNSAAVRSTR